MLNLLERLAARFLRNRATRIFVQHDTEGNFRGGWISGSGWYINVKP